MRFVVGFLHRALMMVRESFGYAFGKDPREPLLLQVLSCRRRKWSRRSLDMLPCMAEAEKSCSGGSREVVVDVMVLRVKGSSKRGSVYVVSRDGACSGASKSDDSLALASARSLPMEAGSLWPVCERI